MDTGTSHDQWLAIHHSQLLEWLLARLGMALLLGAVVTLLIGGIAWQQGNVGWVIAAPALGLIALAVMLVFSSPPAPLDPDDPRFS